MKTNQNTFMRYEMKYLVSTEQRKAIMEMVGKYMEPDEYGRSGMTQGFADSSTQGSILYVLVCHTAGRNDRYAEGFKREGYCKIQPHKAVPVS